MIQRNGQYSVPTSRWLGQKHSSAPEIRCWTLCAVHTWSTSARDLGLSRTEVHATLTQAIEGLLEEQK